LKVCFQSKICNLQSAICNLQSAICNLQSAICNLQSAICNLQSAICNRTYGSPAVGTFGLRFQVVAKALGQVIKHAPNLAQTPQLGGESVEVKISAAVSAA
jgi:hypothetical protein